jgi:hypothetical protein
MSSTLLAAAKSKEVQTLLKSIVESRGIAVEHVTAFGFKYDSAFWIAVGTDAERERLFVDHQLHEDLFAVFAKTGYLRLVEKIWNDEVKNPRLTHFQKPSFTFQSQETVDRDFRGNWYYAMK